MNSNLYLNSNVLVCFRNRIEKEKKTQSPVNQPKTNPAQPKIPAQSNPARPTSPSPFPLTSARFLGPTFSPLFPTCRLVPLFRGPTTAPRPVTSRVVPHFPARMSAPAPASARPLARRLPSPSPGPQGSHAQAQPRSHQPEAFARAQAHKSAPLTRASRSLHRH